MNKTTKAAVATATGIVLLMGGAGSLAYWNGTHNLGQTGQQIAGRNADGHAGSGSWTELLERYSTQVGPTVTQCLARSAADRARQQAHLHADLHDRGPGPGPVLHDGFG